MLRAAPEDQRGHALAKKKRSKQSREALLQRRIRGSYDPDEADSIREEHLGMSLQAYVCAEWCRAKLGIRQGQ